MQAVFAVVPGVPITLPTAVAPQDGAVEGVDFADVMLADPMPAEAAVAGQSEPGLPAAAPEVGEGTVVAVPAFWPPMAFVVAPPPPVASATSDVAAVAGVQVARVSPGPEVPSLASGVDLIPVATDARIAFAPWTAPGGGAEADLAPAQPDKRAIASAQPGQAVKAAADVPAPEVVPAADSPVHTFLASGQSAQSAVPVAAPGNGQAELPPDSPAPDAPAPDAPAPGGAPARQAGPAPAALSTGFANREILPVPSEEHRIDSVRPPTSLAEPIPQPASPASSAMPPTGLDTKAASPQPASIPTSPSGSPIEPPALHPTLAPAVQTLPAPVAAAATSAPIPTVAQVLAPAVVAVAVGTGLATALPQMDQTPPSGTRPEMPPPRTAVAALGEVVRTPALLTPAPAALAIRPPLPAWLELAELDHRAEPEFGIGQSALTSAGPVTSAPAAAPTAASVPQTVAVQVMQGLARHQDGTTEITLSPEELGTVRLRLRPDPRDAERMVVMLSFDRPETMDLFRRHADQLAEAIRSAGYAGVDIGFDQGEQSRGGFADTAGDPTGEAGDSPPAPPPMPHPPPPRLISAATLDLRL